MWYICGILTWKETLQSMKQNKNESKGIYAFANKIYELRNEKKMEYFELSRITGINDVGYLSKLENASIINPSAGKIIRIGQVLEADIFELLSLSKNREKNEGIQLRIEVDNGTISFILDFVDDINGFNIFTRSVRNALFLVKRGEIIFTNSIDFIKRNTHKEVYDDYHEQIAVNVVEYREKDYLILDFNSFFVDFPLSSACKNEIVKAIQQDGMQAVIQFIVRVPEKVGSAESLAKLLWLYSQGEVVESRIFAIENIYRMDCIDSRDLC